VDASGAPPAQASSTASQGEHVTQRAVLSPRPSGARDGAASGTAPTVEARATRSRPASRRALWLALAGGLVLVLGALALRNGGRMKAPATTVPATSQSASEPPAENILRPSVTAQGPVAPSGSSSASSGDTSANQAVVPGSAAAAPTVPRTPSAKRPTRQSAKADIPQQPPIDPFAQRK
jgi:hypothetical protein